MDEASQLGSIDAQWARIRGRLRAEVGEAAFKSWLNPLIFDGVRDGFETGTDCGGPCTACMSP